MDRILITQDDQAVREIPALVLERAGHLGDQAGDGQEGIHRYRTRPADLLAPAGSD